MLVQTLKAQYRSFVPLAVYDSSSPKSSPGITQIQQTGTYLLQP
jgi:hypothetical protein